MISRQNLVAGASGLVAGLLGAVIAVRLALPAAKVADPPSSPAAAVVLPPGWDPRVGAQIAGLERRMGAAEAALKASPGGQPGAAGAEPEPAPAPPQERGRGSRGEAERMAHYQQELQSLAERTASHEGEPLDAAWAAPLADSIRDGLSDRGDQRQFEVKGVDCRSRTCIATLTFQSPAEALGFIAHGDQGLRPNGCHGFTITPPPPAGEGRYDLPILFSCR